MRKLATVFVSVLALVAVLAGCSGRSPEDESGGTISRGKVVAINAAENVIVLDHEEIPGIMMAMTMGFAVAEPALFEGLEVGDAVEFEIEQKQQGLTIVAIKKIDASELGDLGQSSYEGKAKVVAAVPATGTIMVRATDIPGISGDGDLVYAVNPPSLLEGIAEGDEVEIKLEDDGNAQGQLVVVALEKVN